MLELFINRCVLCWSYLLMGVFMLQVFNCGYILF